MNSKSDILRDIIAKIQRFDACRGRVISADTNLLTEIDLDSLTILELNEILLEAYGINFFTPPRSLADLKSPESIAAAIAAFRQPEGGLRL